MATNEARGEQGEEFGAGRPSEPGCGFSHTSTTTTYNMINCGQVIQIGGQNATVILPENRVGVLHGDVRGFQATSSTHPHPSHPPHTPQPSTAPTTAVVNTLTLGEIRYAAGTLPLPFSSSSPPIFPLPLTFPPSLTSFLFPSPLLSPLPHSQARLSPWSC